MQRTETTRFVRTVALIRFPPQCKEKEMKNRFTRGILLAGTLVAVTGCASTSPPPPTLQTGPDAEVTIDGLVRIDNAVVPVAYRKPDLDLSPYTRFMLDPVEITYQRDPGSRRRSDMPGSSGNFALSAAQMETLRGMFQEAVVEALTRDGGYELTTEAAPDVLRVSASLVDLVVNVPMERTGRQEVYTRSYGLVSLILELSDSETGEALVRAGDRRDPTRNTDVNLASVSPAFVRADVNRLFQHWANLLRERLDAFRGS
jgi:hypothetical protein